MESCEPIKRFRDKKKTTSYLFDDYFALLCSETATVSRCTYRLPHRLSLPYRRGVVYSVFSNFFIDGSKFPYLYGIWMRNFGAVRPWKCIGDGCEFSSKSIHRSIGSVVGVERLFVFGRLVVCSDICGNTVVFGKNVICFVSNFKRNTHENR